MMTTIRLFALIVCFWATAAYTAEPSLDELRSRFEKWQRTYTAATISEQKKQLDGLKDYPLYPYAQYQYLNNHLATISPDEVNQFFLQNRNSPLASSLMQAYIEKLTQQKAWQKITEMRVDHSLASRCRYQFALLQQGQTEKALMSVGTMWLSANDLPAACDPLFAEWGKTDEKTANLILLRIELVLQNNNIKLARYLTQQLPDNYKTLKKNLLALYDNPKKLVDFSKNISPSRFSQKIIMLSFPRLVRVDSELAKTALPTIMKQQKLTQSDENRLLRSIAVSYFNDSATSEQKKWRDHYIAKNRDGSLIERNLRVAIKENNFSDIAYWLNLLPKADGNKDEWRYWRAMVLAHDNQHKEANTILADLAKGRGFYPMLSAQRLGQPYHFDLNYMVIANASPQSELVLLEKKYTGKPIINRIHELRFWGMLIESNREWRYYLSEADSPEEYAELARYAYLQGWGDHSVQATISGKLWDNWIERFPVVYEDIFNRSLNEKAIPLSYALAIARQESALDPSVQSPAGARGLMQLMPGTAKDSSKKVTDIDYTSVSQLYDPEINIQLGTYYLNYVYQRFDNNRILASAAYNAGPARVSRWRQETQDKLDAAAFIESIPFTETRNYVKSVLVYDYIYQLMLKGQPAGILQEAEIASSY